MATIKTLIPDSKIVEFNAVISKKDKRPFSNKPGNFLTFKLSDKTGDIVGQRWDNIESLDALKEGEVVIARGVVDEYRGQKQLKINELIPIEDFDPSDFIASYSSQEIIAAISYIDSVMKTIKEPFLKKLWKSFRKDQIFWERFRTAPAAIGYHHNRLGGLAVHTASVMRLCESFITQYQLTNYKKDLLLLGAALHDIGKIKEYVYETFIGMSTEGRLLGHISIAMGMLQLKIEDIKDFPEEF
ncbi:MAG: hypothetical protein C0601_01015 [Candidatus Muiribacterium halophilum]|uniref:HD domain-containing protein n=1 Tax=Muiribacterium halophilum TaxID=2053465 RepID=A0A2N5ZM67_MUIH1|nr:MAG: hypothetical protein C0601_01015 [Candidatus Muirbacterium halophilum]